LAARAAHRDDRSIVIERATRLDAIVSAFASSKGHGARSRSTPKLAHDQRIVGVGDGGTGRPDVREERPFLARDIRERPADSTSVSQSDVGHDAYIRFDKGTQLFDLSRLAHSDFEYGKRVARLDAQNYGWNAHEVI
jgi:hypothetical protein